MFRSILATAILMLCATCATAVDVEWVDDLDSALTESARSKKPVFLHFYADWCVPCHRLERVIFRDDKWISSIRRNCVPLKVNLDAHPELAQKYGVTSIPTDVYLTATGEVIANERSPSSVEGYSQTIAQISKRDSRAELPPVVTSEMAEAPAPVEARPGRSGGSSFFAEALGKCDSEATASREHAPVK